MAKVELDIPVALLDAINKSCEEDGIRLQELVVVQLSLYMNSKNKKKAKMTKEKLCQK